jgi:glycosyltransferase involved in cell wall biosynthesis
MTRRLRVVHVTGCLDMGGQEKLLVEFAKHADRDRFELRFVSLESRGLLADEIEAQGWPVTTLNIAPGLRLGLPLRLSKMVRGWQADIVHTHNDRPLIYGAPAARLARVAGVIHTKHGRGAINSSRQNCLAAWSARLTDQFVCVSDDCARLAVEQGVPTSRIATIHNGIDTRRFAFTQLDVNGLAVVVARFSPEKDLATLLHAVALVVRDVPRFQLSIAGDGVESQQLHELAAALQISENVRFLGLVRDVPALLRQARIFVMSSISEGVPLTLLEAMATGLPCVATRVGGIPEALEDGVTGVLVPPRDPPALAAALLQLQCDNELAQRMGNAGRRRVEELFDVRNMVARYERIYQTVCGDALPAGTACAKPQAMEVEVHECASHT